MSRGENRRQWIHFAMVAFCLLLRWLNTWQAAGMALGAVGFNLFVLPLLRVGRDIARESEPFLSGLKFYPVAVLLVILLFPLPIAAASWGVLAAGDCFSNLAGRAWGRTKLPWNQKKSIVGSLAFVATAFPVAWFFGWWAWLGHPDARLDARGLAMLAAGGAVAGAIVESLDTPIDDNLSVTLTSALVMAGMAYAYVG
jgi:dolichol kinase